MFARVATMATRKSGSRSRSSKRSAGRKGAAKSSSSARSGRRYGPAASKKVEGAMHEMKRGELTSGRSKKKARSRKQAIAIGLSEARREGGKVPSPRGRKKAGGRS